MERGAGPTHSPPAGTHPGHHRVRSDRVRRRIPVGVCVRSARCVLICGAGPVGLRAGVEAAVLGFEVESTGWRFLEQGHATPRLILGSPLGPSHE